MSHTNSPGSGAAAHVDAPRRSLWRSAIRAIRSAVPFFAGIVAGGVVIHEIETSALQAHFFARYAQGLSYELGDGASDQVAFPRGGPLNRRRGYSALPQLVGRLTENGFVVSEQVRMSAELQRIVELGIAPPYPEPSVAGLFVRSSDGVVLHDARSRGTVFTDYDKIPRLIVDTLLFIEDKSLLAGDDPRRNPTLEWDRLVKAMFLFSASKVGFSVNVEGGSTLATQLEKFRHSPNGRTSSPQEKLRQITSASLKAYRDGEDTTIRRREIVVEYLNSMPLAAAPGFGEVHGLGEGLRAWFGLSLDEVSADLDEGSPTESRAHAFKHVLALLAALPAPSTFLSANRGALERRMASFATLLEQEGVIEPELARIVRAIPMHFAHHSSPPAARDFIDRKAETAARKRLLSVTQVPSMYELDRLDLESEFTIDMGMQDQVVSLFRDLADKDFVASHGLNYKHLLMRADPAKVLYTFLLFERTAAGDLLRVQADSLNEPFDLNRGAKIELGSTAKLRTMAHYLEIVGLLFRDLEPLDVASLRIRARAGRDPLTRWVATELSAEPRPDLQELVDRALDRKYSAWSGESFFTAGGMQRFVNFGRTVWRMPTLRNAFYHSINLPFIRLMRDLMLYHRARLNYDADLVVSDLDDPKRLEILTEIAEAESRHSLARAYRKLNGLNEFELVERVVRRERRPERKLRKVAILYFAWHEKRDVAALGEWLRRHIGETDDDDVLRMWRAYGNPTLGLSDYAYLMSRRPLEIWCGGMLLAQPELSRDALLRRSAGARRSSYRWLFQTRNRRAQERRLNVRMERDAFERMTSYWQRLGFPFSRLVASYATAIGSSGDRPIGLATLLGIILNDGMKSAPVTLSELRFGRDTPYETALRPRQDRAERVMEVPVARALQALLRGVVEHGTGISVSGVFFDARGMPARVGGKTGTGDNRRKTFNRWGELRSSHAVNRTASFVFFVDRYYGVLTAMVPGRDAERYGFTSKLPLKVLKLLAPMLNRSLDEGRTMARLERAGSGSS